MDNELQEIQKILLELYQKNLNFLQENFPAIYQKVEDMSKSIESGEYKEKYALEMMNGYFDIKNLENDGYYYASNSYEDALGRAKYNDFSAKSSWDFLRKHPLTKKIIQGEAFKDVMPIVDYINEKVDLENVEFKEIFKMAFIGTGLGFHINEIYKKLNPKIVLIIEPELEIFRLSLFTIDYSEFTGEHKNLMFSIGDDKKERANIYDVFFHYQDFVNFNAKHYTLLDNLEYIKDEMTDHFTRNPTYGFPYKFLIYNLHITLDLMKKGKKFINQNLLSKNKVFEKDKILLISAGPSVDNYVEWIREHQDSFIIVCVDVITKKLEKNGIVPDIVVTIDPSPLCGEFLETEDPNYLKNSAIVLLTQQDQKTIDVVEKLNPYFSQSVPIIEEIGYLGSVPNVGTFSFAFMVFVGAKEMYLVGNDAAFNQETGDRYSKDSAFYVKDNLKGNLGKNIVTGNDVIEVKGNLRPLVKTNREIYSFKDDYERFMDHIDTKMCKIYNLSDGAYIEGMTPLTKKDLTVSLKKNSLVEKNILEKMDKIAHEIESYNFDQEIKVVNSVLRKITKYKKTIYKHRDDFLQNKLDLMIWILEQTKQSGNGVIPGLFLRFTSLADIHVNFVLNLRQKNLHTKEEINILAQMWLEGVYQLFKDIKKALVV